MRRLVCIALGIVLIASAAAWAGWEEIASLNTARGNHSAVVVDGVLYVIGGEWDGDGTAPVEKYDPVADVWTEIGPSAPNAAGANTGVYDGVIYVMGGVHVEDDAIYEGGGYMWDTRANPTPVWEPTPGGGPTMGHGDSPGPTLVGTKIYLLSGEDDDIDNAWPDYVKVVDIYDIVTGEWTVGASIEPYQREDQGVAAVGTKILVMGGEYQDEPCRILNIYDTQLNEWKHIEDIPVGWEKLRMVPIGDLVYIATGDGAGGNVTWTLDLFTMEYTRVQAILPLRLAEAALAVLDGQLVAIGGEEAASEELVGNAFILRE
ncbi:MAG: hypothetical protein JSW65_07960 [Candidatus Bipolaricaulota bacterium]|nr:MAG: hypothetical protein JSW65_07960 [Candidatus Bipolaricaulota bacterium]